MRPHAVRIIERAAAVLVIGAASLLPTTAVTDASWQDSEIPRATFTAVDVPEPAMTSACTTRDGARGINRITVNWRVPAGVAGYTSADVEFGKRIGNGAYTAIAASSIASVTTTGTTSAYVTQLAGTPVQGTLGSNNTVAARFKTSSGWTSDWVDLCTFAAVRPRILNSQISVTASSEEPGGGAAYGLASYVNDDDKAVFWHSRFATTPYGAFPYVLVLDLGKAQSIDGLGYIARQPPYWPIKGYTLETSTDGQTYTRVATGDWANSAAWQDVNFTATTARYLRVTATSSNSKGTHAEIAELVVYGTPTT